MIFNLQMKRSERIGVALTLSTGVLAGVTGVMKAYQAELLADLTSPQDSKSTILARRKSDLLTSALPSAIQPSPQLGLVHG